MPNTEKCLIAYKEDGTIEDYLGIDMPANVKNDTKALELLGGLDMISKVVSVPNRRLELRFQPRNAFCKPVCGDKISTNNLLISIKRGYRKKKSDTKVDFSKMDLQIETKLLGTVKDTYQFNTMCDAQYLPQCTPSGPTYASLTPTTLHHHQWLAGDCEAFLPPASFSRMDTPQHFYYRGDGSDSFMKNPKLKKRMAANRKAAKAALSLSAKKTAKDGASGSQSQPNVICATRQPRTLFPKFMYFVDPTPMEPDPRAISEVNRKVVKHSMAPIYQMVVEMFEKRPIWTKKALQIELKTGGDILKYILPIVAYYFINGPWRKLWVRFGYDPRSDEKSFIYQTFDLRIRSGPTKSLIGAKTCFTKHLPHFGKKNKKKVSLIQSDLIEAAADETDEPEVEDALNEIKREMKPSDDAEEEGKGIEDSYIFKEDSMPSTRQTFYQYVDIHLPEVKSLLGNFIVDASHQLECDEKHGWFSQEVEENVRIILLDRIEAAVRDKAGIVLNDESDDESSEDSEEEELDDQ